jgi:hypothetical protein
MSLQICIVNANLRVVAIGVAPHLLPEAFVAHETHRYWTQGSAVPPEIAGVTEGDRTPFGALGRRMRSPYTSFTAPCALPVRLRSDLLDQGQSVRDLAHETHR